MGSQASLQSCTCRSKQERGQSPSRGEKAVSPIPGHTVSRIRSRDLRKGEKAEQELMEGYDQGSNGSAAK